MFNIQIKNQKSWKKRDLILLLERLELYLSSGLEIDKALEISGDGMNKKQKNLIYQIKIEVSSGHSLSNSLRKYIKISKTVINLIEHGEFSGLLSKSLFNAKQLLEREDELYKKSINALIYPMVIGIFVILLTIALVKGVLNQIVPMLKSLDVDLPFITKLTILFSELITNYIFYIIGVLIFGLLIFKIIYRRYKKIRSIFQSFIIRIPLIGKIIYKYHIALFLHSSGILIDSGLSVKNVYIQTVSTINLIPLSNLLESKNLMIDRGVSIGSILVDKRIPIFISSLLNAGEASGFLAKSIIRAGEILDKEIENSLKRLSSLIEPIMMIIMGCIVGTIAISIMLPIYSISSSLQK